MSLRLKNKKLIKRIFFLTISPLLAILIFFSARGSIWTIWDYKILDLVYRQAVQYGYGPETSNRIVYLPITSDTYNYFGKNILDRTDLAMVNDAFSKLDIEALVYDIIFARPSNPESDERFAQSIKQLNSCYLPIGFAYSENRKSFKWESGAAFERFKSGYLHRPVEKGMPDPYYAVSALMQADNLFMAAFNSGHISSFSDADGVYRHMIMLLKVDDSYFPSIALSMFLDYAGVPFEKIVVHWGKEIVIPSIKGSRLDYDVIIPIDDRGRAFIPFVQVWQKDFPKMEAQKLLEYIKEEDLQGNLRDFFEGKFVLIGDISVGISDLGQTPLEKDVPLLVLHTSMLNALLTDTFYKKSSFIQGIIFIVIISVLLGVSALSKRSWVLYSAGALILCCIMGMTWIQFIRFNLFPVATLSGSFLFIFFTLISGIGIAVSRERSFIKNTFSRYVPQKIVDHLLENPALLKLGGEERIITVLFSDVAGFTTISENMSPPDLVNLLNEYLTEMTDIVLEEGGIIDKYQGDAIMAEFGVPIHMANNADMAVRTGLRMQRRLKKLCQEWHGMGLPELRCRIGINTGPMIIGNMGSHQFSDYTVIGDAVNLASRLEGANKRYNTCLMISEFTHENLTPGIFKTRLLDVIRVKGKRTAVKVFEVYGETSEVAENDRELYYQIYQRAFEMYLEREFASAGDAFKKALSMRPDDPAAKDMINRINDINFKDLPADWDGSVTLTSK
jgi:adenylate cyclase